MVGLGPDGKLGTADDVLREGNPACARSAPHGVVLTGHAFLDDIAHAAVPDRRLAAVLCCRIATPHWATPMPMAPPDLRASADPLPTTTSCSTAHFIAGDGRANENIALTAVHQVFHSEHNRIVEQTKEVALRVRRISPSSTSGC